MALLSKSKRTAEMLVRHPSESILGVQLTGRTPEAVGKAVAAFHGQDDEAVGEAEGAGLDRVSQDADVIADGHVQLEPIDVVPEVLQGVVMEGFVSNHDRSRSIINISDPDVLIEQSRGHAGECSITK